MSEQNINESKPKRSELGSILSPAIGGAAGMVFGIINSVVFLDLAKTYLEASGIAIGNEIIDSSFFLSIVIHGVLGLFLGAKYYHDNTNP